MDGMFRFTKRNYMLKMGNIIVNVDLKKEMPM